MFLTLAQFPDPLHNLEGPPIVIVAFGVNQGSYRYANCDKR